MFKSIDRDVIEFLADNPNALQAVRHWMQDLTATQTRCNELLEENREHKRHIAEIRQRWADMLGSDGRMP